MTVFNDSAFFERTLRGRFRESPTSWSAKVKAAPPQKGWHTRHRSYLCAFGCNHKPWGPWPRGPNPLPPQETLLCCMSLGMAGCWGISFFSSGSASSKLSKPWGRVRKIEQSNEFPLEFFKSHQVTFLLIAQHGPVKFLLGDIATAVVLIPLNHFFQALPFGFP